MQYTLVQWPFHQPTVEGFDPQSQSPIDGGGEDYAYRRVQFLNANPAENIIAKCAADCGLVITASDKNPDVAYRMDKYETRRPWYWQIQDWDKPGNSAGPINQLFALCFAKGFVPDFTKPWEFNGSFYILPAFDPATGIPFGFKFNS